MYMRSILLTVYEYMSGPTRAGTPADTSSGTHRTPAFCTAALHKKLEHILGNFRRRTYRQNQTSKSEPQASPRTARRKPPKIDAVQQDDDGRSELEIDLSRLTCKQRVGNKHVTCGCNAADRYT